MALSKPIPAVLDTDVGTDIDDTWAIAMMLRSPELNVRLITTATQDTTYRATLVAKQLEMAGRTDVPIGIGIREPGAPAAPGWEYRIAGWVKDYNLKKFPGTIHEDGVAAMIEILMNSPEPVTLISIAPLPNVAAALDREPRIAPRTRFVGMHGSVRRGYGGLQQADAEYNVKNNVPAARKAFTAPWKDMTITPLDTCGIVSLQGRRYQAIRQSQDPAVRAVIESFQIWLKGQPDEGRSSTLFDTVAIYLAFATARLRMEKLRIRITDEGKMVEDPAAPLVNAAMDWTDLEGYYDFLTARLLGQA
jgi:inosine-uridine nucleoside N-ribohydrolase